MSGNPAPTSYVGNSEMVTNKEAMGRLGQLTFHSPIEATGLFVVAIDGVLDLLRRVFCRNPLSI